MRVFIEDMAFAMTEEALALPSLFQLGFEERHNIVCEEGGASFRAWMSARPRVEQEQVQVALNGSFERESKRASAVKLRVGPAPPALRPSDALVRLRQPAVVILENASRDWPLLRAVARQEARQELERARDKQWLRLEHSGGNDVQPVLDRLPVDERANGRCFLVTDSDALAPGRPSATAKKARRAGVQALGPERTLMLERRGAENYLPQEAFERWRDQSNESRDVCDARLGAWTRLSDEQKHYLNVKQGFGRDRKRLKAELADRTLDEHDVVLAPDGTPSHHALYRDIPAEDLRALDAGFGTDIVMDFLVHRDWYEQHERWREGAIDTEFTPLLDRILRAL